MSEPAVDDETFQHLKATVERFVAERLVPNEMRLEIEDEVPEEIVAEMRELGLFGLTIPPEYGGIGLTASQESQLAMIFGGTALALRTGSRESEDFDFFTNDHVDAHTLASTVSWLRDAELVQAAPSTATFLVDRGGRVKISFVGALTLGRVGDVSEAVDTGVRRAAQAVRSVEMVEVLSATLA